MIVKIKAECACKTDDRYNLRGFVFELESNSEEGFKNDEFLNATVKFLRAKILERFPVDLGNSKQFLVTSFGIIDENNKVLGSSSIGVSFTSEEVKIERDNCACLFVIQPRNSSEFVFAARLQVVE